MNDGVLLQEGPGAAASDFDNIELRTVGIDIGTATSHVTFSQVHLQRLGDHLSSRYVPVERRILYESRIILTPYLDDYSIDAGALAAFVEAIYRDAGISRSEVDSGAVILTGEAVKRKNARAITDSLASIAGEFVCATAGARLEAIIAAHGSGSVALSRAEPDRTILNVDIGGGTTKFAVVEDGTIVSTAAISIGGRLIATAGNRITRAEPAGVWFARSHGIDVTLGVPLGEDSRGVIARGMASVLADVLLGRPVTSEADWLWVTPALGPLAAPPMIVFSGGVAQYLLGLEFEDYGDLGRLLGDALRGELVAAEAWSRVAKSAQTIRATVIGASQYTVQVSGNTVSVSDPTLLPMRNVRVVSSSVVFPLLNHDREQLAESIRTDLRRHELEPGHEIFAIAFRWRGTPFYSDLLTLAEGVAAAMAADGPSKHPLILLFDGDVGRSVGEILRIEVGWPGPVLCLDGVRVDDFDFVDIGRRIEPSGTFPLVVKSLVYPST